MTIQQDLRKSWPKTRKQLQEFGKEALVLAERSKKEIIRLSKEGKLHLDFTALDLKKEHLFYLIGKEYVKANYPSEHTSKLKKLIAEINQINREQRSLKNAMETKRKDSGY